MNTSFQELGASDLVDAHLEVLRIVWCIMNHTASMNMSSVRREDCLRLAVAGQSEGAKSNTGPSVKEASLGVWSLVNGRHSESQTSVTQEPALPSVRGVE